jgi:hypothetical protein
LLGPRAASGHQHRNDHVRSESAPTPIASELSRCSNNEPGQEGKWQAVQVMRVRTRIGAQAA